MTDDTPADLVALRSRREAERMVEAAKRLPPLKYDIDLTALTVKFNGTVYGDAANPSLSIVLYDISDEIGHALGTLKLTKEQWEELKRHGDTMYDAHERLVQSRKPDNTQPAS